MTKPRPFRFGLLGESVRSAADLVDAARRAEAAGYATFLMRDHFIEEPFGHQPAPLTALATAAAAVTRQTPGEDPRTRRAMTENGRLCHGDGGHEGATAGGRR